MPRSAIATRIVVAIIMSAFVAAAGAELLFGRVSMVAMIVLAVLLVGLRVTARKMKKTGKTREPA